MTEEQDRRRLGHIHDFIMRTICEVDVGRDSPMQLQSRVRKTIRNARGP